MTTNDADGPIAIGGIAPGHSSRCTVKLLRSECNEGCDWCIYVTVVTCADTLTLPLVDIWGG